MAKDREAFDLQSTRLKNTLEDVLEGFYTMDYGLLELQDVLNIAREALGEFDAKWTWDKPTIDRTSETRIVPGIIA